jgi:3-methyl-2-oxobutanoate hydroxymethyltransferase
MLGITKEFKPRFLRRYLNLADEIQNAVKQYVDDVKSKNFPNKEEQY